MLESENQATIRNYKIIHFGEFCVPYFLVAKIKTKTKQQHKPLWSVYFALVKKHVGHVFCEEEQAILLHRKLHSYVTV